MRLVLDNVDLYGAGMAMTVALTLLSFSAALVIGTVVAAFRVSPVPPLRTAGTLWVESVRNTPLTVLMVLFFFGFTKLGIRYSAFTSAVIVLSAYTSTFVAETVRSGINAVAKGQAEAARSLGLTFPQVLGRVVLPQAFRTVVAPLGSVFIALVKNSSIASIISVVDLTEVADRLNNETARPVAVFLGAGVAYLFLTLPSGFLVGVLERRVAIKR
ncbi:MAG TPA: amino acid ABC transporter permease [Acidimicrobiales bacterium]|nr:amino acid ABC transporter permease [Acidimicrobiales bacterium]